MSIPLPSALVRAPVTWTLGHADTTGPLKAARGFVRFEASAVAVAYSDRTVLPSPVETPFVDGVMYPVHLIVNDPEVWNWKVTVKAGGVTWDPFHVNVPAEGTNLASASITPGKGPVRVLKGDQGIQGIQGERGPEGPYGGTEVTDPQVASYLHTDTETRQAVLEATRLNVVPARITAATAVAGLEPRPVEVLDGVMWGYAGGRMYSAATPGTWVDRFPTPDGAPIQRILPCADGEVLCAQYAGVYRSSGWQTGTPSWTKVITRHGAAHIQPFSISGDGMKFIQSDYGDYTDSRYGRISLDGGHTWTVVYDSVARYGAAIANTTHVHGVAYDPASDRFYLAEGHSSAASVYVSDDDGATWMRPPGLIENPAPTTMEPTDDGLVCGSDSSRAGLLGIIRQDNPMDEELQHTYNWAPGVRGVIGFGVSSHRDPDTGVVYVGFRNGFAGVKPVILGGTAASGSMVWEWDGPAALVDDVAHAIPWAGKLWAWGLLNGETRVIQGTLPAPGTPPTDTPVVVAGDAVSIGPTSDVGTALRSLAIGVGATATADDAAAVGFGATAGTQGTTLGVSSKAGAGAVAFGQLADAAANGVSIGQGVEAGAESTSVGFGSTATGVFSVAYGRSAKALGPYGLAVGASADSGEASNATALGRSAKATSEAATALGATATASHWRSVALGQGTTTTGNEQIQIGARHIEIGEVAAWPAAPPTNTARLYLRDNGAGKSQVVVKWAGGAETVIATEP